jgi:rhamnulokinase
MINAQSHDWDEEIISKFNLPKKLFKKLAMPGTVVGKFTKEIENRVGYSATVMLPATHDTASAVLATPIIDGAPYISSGTWSLLGIEQEKARTDGESMKNNYSNEGSLNFTFRYQKNIMGLWIIQQVRHELDDRYSFAQLVDMARESVTDKVIDVNDEKFLAPQSMIDAVQSEIGKVSVGEMAYCIFNSLAKCYARCVDELESATGKKHDILHVIGGGSKNALLNELTAKETGKKIIAGPVECTAIGNLIMQMIGTGKIENLSRAREIIKNSFTIEEV